MTGWIVNGVTTESLSTTHTVQIEAATTVSAVMVPDHYAVTFGANQDTWGTIRAEGAETSPVTVAYGKSVTFTATPSAYYYISGWQVDGEMVEGTANQTTFTLTDVKAEHTVTVVFASALSYEVGYDSGENGTVSATVNGEELDLDSGVSQNIQGGSKVEFTATPASANFMTAGWEVSTDGGKTYQAVTKDNMGALGLSMVHPLSNVLTVDSLNENLRVRATYEQYVGYAIPTSGSGYTVTVDHRSPADTMPESEIRWGGDVTFTVAPEDSKALATLTVNGVDCLTTASSGDAANKLTVVKQDDGSYTITVENVQDKISLTAAAVSGKLVLDCGEHGSLKVLKNGAAMSDGDVVQKGDVLTITAMAESGYRLSSLTVDGKSFASGSTYTVAANGVDLTIKAEFAVQTSGGGGGGAVATTYPITVTKSDRGEVTVSADSAAAGDEITVTAKAKEGYKVNGVTVTDEKGTAVAVADKGDGVYTFSMPESGVTVAADFRCDGGENCASKAFTDLVYDWYHEAIDYVVDNGLMTGVSADRFAPDSTLTRGMIVTILWRLENEPQVDAVLPFGDVETGKWYTEAVRWAVSEGIVNGVTDTSYAPDSNLTREQMAAILYRYAQYKGLETTAADGQLNGFADRNDVTAYAETALNWAVGQKLINGVTDDTLNPQGTATRAQVATILMRFCENIAK